MIQPTNQCGGAGTAITSRIGRNWRGQTGIIDCLVRLFCVRWKSRVEVPRVSCFASRRYKSLASRLTSEGAGHAVVSEMLAKQRGWSVFLLSLATFLVYGPVAGYPFLNYDDQFFVTENACVKQGLTRESFFWSW